MVIQNEEENEFLRRLSRDIGGISFLTCLYIWEQHPSIFIYLSIAAVIWPKYCRNGVKHYIINQYIYLSIYRSVYLSIHPLNNLSIQFVETVWIGGTDSTEEGSWTWTESTDAMSFTAWGPDQPNNAYQNEDCLCLFLEHNFMWADRDCLTTYKYICEKN